MQDIQAIFQGFLEVVKTDFQGMALLVGLCLIGILLIALVMHALTKSSFKSAGAAGTGFDHTSRIRGKVERLEQEVNELKTISHRSYEFSKFEFEFVREQLTEIKSLIAGEKTEFSEDAVTSAATATTTPHAGHILEAKEVDAEPAPEGMTGEEEDSSILSEWNPGRADEESQSQSSQSGLSESSQSGLSESSQPSEIEEPGFGALSKGGPGGSPEIVGSSTKKKIEEFSEKADSSLSSRLKRTRGGILKRVKELFEGKQNLDPEMLEELEAALIFADMGVNTVGSLIAELQEEINKGTEVTEDSLKGILEKKIEGILKADCDGAGLAVDKPEDGPRIVMLVGVNGSGKTTTAAKLAGKWKAEGHSLMLVAADTFRAAAVEQLAHWGDKLGVPVVKGEAEAKPGTVVFDAVKQAKEEGTDIVIIDTAGRLHTKSNLMQELEGVLNVIKKQQASAPHEVILVVDGSTGQNALTQAREFNQAAKLTGLVVTKLDGTPKGGIVVAIRDALGLPVKYIGVGESEEDLRVFKAEEFSKALFEEGNESSGKRRDTIWKL